MCTNDADWSWLAAIVEGEGYMGVLNQLHRSGRRYPSPTIQVANADLDMLQEAIRIAGVGKIYQRKQNGAYKTTWVWKINRKTEMAELLLQLLPYMRTERRVAEARQCLDAAQH